MAVLRSENKQNFPVVYLCKNLFTHGERKLIQAFEEEIWSIFWESQEDGDSISQPTKHV